MRFEDFNGLRPKIKANLQGLNFRRPTDIQFKAIPPILKGEDVLAIAQTGTGKTAAFAIPILQMLSDAKSKKNAEGIRCLVMEPTRELAIQIREAFETLGKGLGLSIYSLTGGVDQDPQIAKLQAGVDILITTPGRMFDLVSQRHLSLRSIEILVLDEADHMLDLGFIKDIRDLIRFLPKKRQTLFFSATIDEEIKKLAYSLVSNAIRIQISPKDPVSKNVQHAVAHIAMDDKRFFLERVVLENPDSKMLVFVRTKVRAERVHKAMERVGIASITMHGGKEQSDRLSVMDQFRKGEVKMLIATDVSARGIDIPNVDLVINYDLPDQAENYVHRVGRTGRGMQKGRAIAFASPEEKPMLEEIETYIGKKVAVLEIGKNEYIETKETSKDITVDMKALLKEIEANEARVKKKRKK